VTEQIKADARNIFGLQLPALLFARLVSAELSVDGAGHDVAHLYPVMPNLLHESFAETVEAEFRGVVGGHARMRVRARQRRDVYDVASAAPLHLRYGFMAAIEDAEEIRLKHGAKIIRGKLLYGSEDAYARVVH
jgi:hypothetical protein